MNAGDLSARVRFGMRARRLDAALLGFRPIAGRSTEGLNGWTRVFVGGEQMEGVPRCSEGRRRETSSEGTPRENGWDRGPRERREQPGEARPGKRRKWGDSDLSKAVLQRVLWSIAKMTGDSGELRLYFGRMLVFPGCVANSGPAAWVVVK